MAKYFQPLNTSRAEHAVDFETSERLVRRTLSDHQFRLVVRIYRSGDFGAHVAQSEMRLVCELVCLGVPLEIIAGRGRCRRVRLHGRMREVWE